MTRATSIDRTASSIVTGSFEPIRSRTRSFVRSDLPRSPRASCPSHARYCTGTGSSRRERSRRAARASGSGGAAARISAGSAGSERWMAKTISVTMNSVGIAVSARRPTKGSTACLASSLTLREGHPLQPYQAVRVRLEALDVRPVREEQDRVVQVDYVPVGQVALERLPVEVVPGLGRRGRARLVQQPVDLLVAVARLVQR